MIYFSFCVSRYPTSCENLKFTFDYVETDSLCRNIQFLHTSIVDLVLNQLTINVCEEQKTSLLDQKLGEMQHMQLFSKSCRFFFTSFCNYPQLTFLGNIGFKWDSSESKSIKLGRKLLSCLASDWDQFTLLPQETPITHS